MKLGMEFLFASTKSILTRIRYKKCAIQTLKRGFRAFNWILQEKILLKNQNIVSVK